MEALIIDWIPTLLRKTSEQVQDMTFLNLDVRLAKALIHLSSNNETSKKSGKVSITHTPGVSPEAHAPIISRSADPAFYLFGS